MGRPLEIKAGRQVLAVDARGYPDSRVREAIVGHVVGRDGDRRGGPLDGERPSPGCIGVIVILILAEKLPCHRVDAGVGEDFVGDRGVERLPVDAIADDDTPLLASVVDHRRRPLDRHLGHVNRAGQFRGEENIVVGKGSGERQACHCHRLAVGGIGVAVGARDAGRDERRRRIPRHEADECRLAEIERGDRAAVVGAGIDGDAADGEPDEDAGKDDVVAVPAAVADPEGLPVAGEEHRPFGQTGERSVGRDFSVVDEDGHRLADRGAALDRDLESGSPETRGIIGRQDVGGRRIPRSGKHHLRPIDRRRLEHDAPNTEAPRNVAADDQRFLIPDLSAPREVVGEEIEGTGVDEPVDDQVPFPGSRWDRSRRTLAEDRSVRGTADNDGVAGVGVGAGERERAGTGLPQRAAGTSKR